MLTIFLVCFVILILIIVLLNPKIDYIRHTWNCKQYKKRFTRWRPRTGIIFTPSLNFWCKFDQGWDLEENDLVNIIYGFTYNGKERNQIVIGWKWNGQNCEYYAKIPSADLIFLGEADLELGDRFELFASNTEYRIKFNSDSFTFPSINKKFWFGVLKYPILKKRKSRPETLSLDLQRLM